MTGCERRRRFEPDLLRDLPQNCPCVAAQVSSPFTSLRIGAFELRWWEHVPNLPPLMANRLAALCGPSRLFPTS